MRGTMWRLVVTVVLWNTIKSEPIPDVSDTRQPRQLDFFECCPCPGRSAQDLDTLSSAPYDVTRHIPSDVTRGFHDDVSRAAVDDCPCRVRGDSDGAASAFFPKAVRPAWSDARPDQAKEDPKPLLHPEVDFASSVLETLRDATDEEYQEALARESARNAARVSELGDAEPDTAKVVTIIVNPQEDDPIPEASHTQETRCAPPLGQVRETELKTPLFKLKPNIFQRNSLDMDSGASNVQENKVSLNKGLEGLRLKTTPEILKLLTKKKSAGDGNIQSMLNIRNKDKKLSKDAKDASSNNNVGLKLPNLNLHSLFNKNAETPAKPLDLNLNKFKIPIIKITQARQPGNTDNSDSKLSPSIIQEQVAEKSKSNAPHFGLKSLLPTEDARTPFSLKNLLNLRDVELIGPNSSKTKLTLPDLKLLPPLRVNRPDTFSKQRKPTESKCNEKKSATNNLEKGVKTEILDAIPHPSENHEVIAAPESNTDISELNNDSTIATEGGHPATQILDAVSHDFQDSNGMIMSDEDNIQSSTPVIEQIQSDDNKNPQISEEANKSSQFSTDNLGNSATIDDSVEFINDDDGNTEFEEVEITEQGDQPFSEIDVSGSVLGGESSEISLSNGDRFEPEINTVTLNAGDLDSIIIDDGEETQFEFQQEDLVDTEGINNPELFREESVSNQGGEQDAEAETTNQAFQVIPIDDVEERGDVSTLEDNSQFTGNEDINNPELFREESLNNQGGEQDAEAETSNQAFQVIDDVEERGDDSTQEDNSQIARNEEEEPIKNLLPSVKERISLTLKTLKDPNAKVLSITRFNRPEDSIKEDNRGSLNSEDMDSHGEDKEHFTLAEKSVDDTKKLNENDLQRMSNTLLHASNSRQLPISDLEEENLSEVSETDTFTNLHGDDNVSAPSNAFETNDSSVLSHTEEIISSEDKEHVSEERGTVDDVNLNDDQLADKICHAETGSAKTVTGEQIERQVSDSTSADLNEMAPAASESLFNVVPNTGSVGSPFLRKNVVEPPSLFDINNLFPPLQPLPSLEIPKLSDITSGITDLLGGNDRAAEEEKISSSEFHSAEDCSDTNPVMATDASTTNLRSSFAPLKALEDINLDIFQINPLAQASPLSSKIPSLNMNRFKTKLALPKSMGLKPMKLQQAFEGKNGGLVGATLTFGPDKLGSSSKAKPVLKLNSILDRQGADILGNSLANMPTLEDLRSTMRANAHSLLNSPLVKQINNPIEDTLRASHTLGNSLLSHTENQMRNLQQSLASTLSEATVSNLNKAGGKFAKPQDLLEMVSTAHEDMNDKLRAIHIDLKDRIESFHDRIKEETNLPTLRSPLGLSIQARSEEVDTSPGRWKIKGERKTSALRTTQSTKKPARTNTSTPRSKSKSVSQQSKIRPFKMSKAASALTPKTVAVPKLKTTSAKPPVFKLPPRNENVKLKQSRPLFGTEERTSKPVARKQIPLFDDFRMTHSTTPRSKNFRSGTSSTKPKSLFKSGQPTKFTNSRTSGQFKSFSDSRGFASEPKPTQIPAPTKSAFKTSSLPRDKPALKSTSLNPVASRTKSPKSSVSLTSPLTSRKSLPKSSLLQSPERLPLLKDIPTLESLLKPTQSPLLGKMRDPIVIRWSRPKQSADSLRPKTGPKTVQPNDMSRSASENNEMVLKTEPMKENVSYKCKMVCVREP